jgi:hypothetical protein
MAGAPRSSCDSLETDLFRDDSDLHYFGSSLEATLWSMVQSQAFFSDSPNKLSSACPLGDTCSHSECASRLISVEAFHCLMCFRGESLQHVRHV